MRMAQKREEQRGSNRQKMEGKVTKKGRLVPGLKIKAGRGAGAPSRSSQHLLLCYSQVKHIIPAEALLNGFCGGNFTRSMTTSADASKHMLR